MGADFSDLRPKGTIIDTTKGTSSGPVSFMQKFNLVAGVIKQGGVRRGAQMAELRVDHPDIGRFAVAKRTEGSLDNFNISASVTDGFIEAVENDSLYTLYSPQSDYEEPFEMVQATAEFYAPSYQNAPKGVGPGCVDENIWRDHADEMEAWDWDEGETVSFRDKWQDYFQKAENAGRFEDGEPMELPARFVWDIILDGAWRNGEPGLFHLDETRRKHSFDGDKHDEYQIYGTNPCAEQPLCEYEACNLGHINLSLMVDEDAPTYDEYVDSIDYQYDTKQAEAYDYFEEAVDFEELDRVIESGTRFLDNVVTMSEFPLDEIEEKVSEMRKIGLGVMGWAQMCYQMGVRYGSDESLQLGRIVMNYIDQKAVKASHELAKERGSFDAWDKSKYANPTEHQDWFENHVYELPQQWEDGYPIRNHNLTTVAPTGTTSMLGDTSGGIEPVYNVAYKKNVGGDIQGDTKLIEFDDVFIATLEANEADLDHTVDEIKEICAEQMDNNEFEGVEGLPVPQWMKDTFVTTNDLTAEEHGLMQRVFQEGVDSGISKTVNLPSDATHADVHDAYMLAVSDDELGATIKGLTVYRDQSREEQVLTTQEYSDLEVENAVEMLEELDGYSVEVPDDDE
jgi:ribonucleoside-diphosphate reductase alpha chain